jgi:hypothetical protein
MGPAFAGATLTSRRVRQWLQRSARLFGARLPARLDELTDPLAA